MILLRNIIVEKKSVIPDEEIKERSWIIVFRYNPSLEVLLVRDEDKKWGLPGGQLDSGETSKEAAKRELKEETDITTDNLEFLKTIYHDKPNKLKVSHIFYVEVPKDIKIKAGTDAEKIKWRSVDMINKENDLSDPKKDAIKLAMEKIYDAKKELKETIDKALSLGLPVELLIERRKRTENGYLIVFEGIDGSGKTTQRRILKRWLENKGWKVKTSKWGHSPSISKLIKIGKAQKWLSPALYSLLHSSDMVWRYENEIKPFLNEGGIVLCDRYYYTSYVRDQLRGVNKKMLDGIYENFAEPNLVIHFKVSPRLAVERLLRNGGFKWYNGGMDIGYHQNIEECAFIYETKMNDQYDELLPKVKNYKCINAERSIDEVFNEIKKFIREKIKEVECPPKETIVKDNISFRNIIDENMNIFRLTKEDAQEVIHKMIVLQEEPELQEEYHITQDQTDYLVKTIPWQGGEWIVSDELLPVVKGEISDHINVLFDIARDALDDGKRGQSLRINKQVIRLGRIFGVGEIQNEAMFPKDFSRHALGSCMGAAALATNYLLSKGIKNFNVVEGWVSLYPDMEEEDWSAHTWIEFPNGRKFDPTRKQWAEWGFNPGEVEYMSIKKTYTPEEYQRICKSEDISKLKK